MAKASHKLKFAVLATDVALFAVYENVVHILLITVNTPPHFKNMWGLPGGLIHPNEVAEEAALRHLKAKAATDDVYLEQLYTFDSVDRDPRGRVVSVAYLGLVRPRQVQSLRSENIWWCPIKDVPHLAYDHDDIVDEAISRLRARVGYTNIIQYLLQTMFTLSDLQKAYEVVVGHSLDKRNFRKKVLDLKLIKNTGKQERGGAYRPADLYTFSEREVNVIEVL